MAHPAVETIARDRAEVFAEGIRAGAPRARQVVDRWHLLCNVSAAFQTIVAGHHRQIKEIAETIRSSTREAGHRDSLAMRTPTNDPLGTTEAVRPQATPEFGAGAIPRLPLSVEERQVRIEGALASAEHIGALASHDQADELAAATRSADDLLDRGAVGRQLRDDGVRSFPNNVASNLAALCQRCHLSHDRPVHSVQRWLTWRASKAIGDLFTGRYR